MKVDEAIRRLMIISAAGNGDHQIVDDDGKPIVNAFKSRTDIQTGNKKITISTKGPYNGKTNRS